MPARKITINGVSNSFEWQVGNTTRFIKFEDITDQDLQDLRTDNARLSVFCGETEHTVPLTEAERFYREYLEWLDKLPR